MSDQKVYGLNLSPLDKETYKVVKRQLDRVTAAESETAEARNLREKVKRLEKELAEANTLIAELQENTNSANLLAKLAKLVRG